MTFNNKILKFGNCNLRRDFESDKRAKMLNF